MTLQQTMELANFNILVATRKANGLVCADCGEGLDGVNIKERNGKEVRLCTKCYLVGFYSGK